MVTIDKLEASKPTRPRHWVPVYCFLILLLAVPAMVIYMACSFNMGDFSTAIFNFLPQVEIKTDTAYFDSLTVWMVLIQPCTLLVINILALFVSIRMATFRHAYWWYAIWVAIAYVVSALMVLFWNLFTFLPAFGDSMSTLIPANVLPIVWNSTVYLNFGLTIALIVALVFGLFYCVNYPAKYECIYMLRKRHLRALLNSEERAAYRRRFYRDYKRGNWISMMLDLHAESLNAKSNERLPEDAYDFLVYYSCLCDSNVKKAVFDEYARHGRYYECRSIYHEIKAKSDAVDGGAKVRIPTYVPSTEPRVERKPKPKVVPPPAPKRRHYRPDEI